MLKVQAIWMSPYHPQTDGLVERFNQTLKQMLRKAATEEGKDWDKLLPYLLFAYWGVPQASTGFSPFELLYGRQVRGPLYSWNGQLWLHQNECTFQKIHSLSTGGAHSRVEASITCPTSPPYVTKQLTALFHTQPPFSYTTHSY